LDTILEAKNLSISFGNNHVLKDVSFELYKNEVLGIIGPNGAGKTVLLNILSGILKQDVGMIMYQGVDIAKKSIPERTKMGIGRTFQVPRPFEHMTAYENGVMGAVFGAGVNEKAAGAISRDILDIIGLSEKSLMFSGKLGLLDRKRLEIGVALTSMPDILLLDEAAGGLTESEVVEILDIVRNIKDAGVSVIWIEHVLQTMVEGADRVMLLAVGSNILTGTPREVLESKEVEEHYLGVEEE
jgi:branched-chain amino acid transport system ATP-binding protein